MTEIIRIPVTTVVGVRVSTGQAGLPGQSAYDLAVSLGFDGSEAEWVASLHGADGADGTNGTNGTNGSDGAPGDPGPANTLSVGTVATGVAGSSVIATITGTAPSQTLNLTIPRGDVGSAGAAGSAGTNGVDGKTVRSGSGVPSSGLGVDGDFYIDTSAHTIYGPKASGAWGSSTSIVGPTGSAGTNGTNGTNGSNGTNGTNGATWRQGSGAPSNGTGADGDFYFRTDTSDVYVRASSTYSIVANIKGATGSTGPTGPAGSLYSVRHDTASGFDYLGTATSGTSDSASSWTITRITLTSPPVVKHATGAWTGRTGLTYS